MKNVIWLFAVCMSLGFYACSTNSSEKVANEVETTDLVDENSVIPEEVDSVGNNLIAEEETDMIVEETSEDEKETEAAKPDRKANPNPVVPPKKGEVVTTKPTSTPVKTIIEEKKEVAKPAPKPAKPAVAPKPRPVSKPAPKPAEVKEEVVSKPVLQLDHAPWDNLLRNNVSSSGVVDYAGFKRKKSELEAYLKHLEEFSPKDNWSKDKKLAYWINLYNAWTVKTVVDNYPIASITDIDGGKTWNVKRVKSGNQTYSLDEVENKIIRPRFKDGRIHFAVNCAAKSCPPLLNRAWTATNLSRNLEKMTKAFINNSSHNTITEKKVVLSKIFEWYAVDFGDLIPYINKYSNTKVDKNATIEYNEYDWKLNGK